MKEEGRRKKEVYIWRYRTPTQKQRPYVLVGVLKRIAMIIFKRSR
jgi:hypothetical protein